VCSVEASRSRSLGAGNFLAAIFLLGSILDFSSWHYPDAKQEKTKSAAVGDGSQWNQTPQFLQIDFDEVNFEHHRSVKKAPTMPVIPSQVVGA
jgi:hypothetical protein